MTKNQRVFIIIALTLLTMHFASSSTFAKNSARNHQHDVNGFFSYR